MELLEFDFRVYDADHKPFSLPAGTMEPPWVPRWMSLANMAVRQRGGTPDAANMLYSWTLQHEAFEDVVYEEYFVPTAPFMSRQEPDYYFKRTISEFMRDDILVCDCGYRRLPHPHILHLLPGFSSVRKATSVRKRSFRTTGRRSPASRNLGTRGSTYSQLYPVRASIRSQKVPLGLSLFTVPLATLYLSLCQYGGCTLTDDPLLKVFHPQTCQLIRTRRMCDDQYYINHSDALGLHAVET
jgi:hypothetical protein